MSDRAQEFVTRWLNRAHFTVDDVDTVMASLLAQSFKQVRTRDAVWKARRVVTDWNMRGAATSAVDDHDVSPKSREVDCGGQAGRAGTNDYAVNQG